ncbi:hypothetical protein RhiirA5_372453 [Rhizophagus irregularis]|uniref:Uncharacterized protein n=1 Tax=Rhizophagus irregularis TaxID=588596 RepID=A0A2N0Q284_9GLOM|nr:hypothetical protein RhiirA5_372453 [Rhizophagus irregularis]
MAAALTYMGSGHYNWGGEDNGLLDYDWSVSHHGFELYLPDGIQIFNLVFGVDGSIDEDKWFGPFDNSTHDICWHFHGHQNSWKDWKNQQWANCGIASTCPFSTSIKYLMYFIQRPRPNHGRYYQVIREVNGPVLRKLSIRDIGIRVLDIGIRDTGTKSRMVPILSGFRKLDFRKLEFEKQQGFGNWVIREIPVRKIDTQAINFREKRIKE